MTNDRKNRAPTLPATVAVASQRTPFPGLPTSDADMRLGAVNDIARALSAPWSLEEVLELVMDRLTWALDADRSTLFLIDGDDIYAEHAQGATAREIRMRIGQGIAGWVAESGRGINVKNAYQDARFDASWDIENKYKTSSLLCQPIFDRHESVIGVVQILNKRDGYFTVDDEKLLATVLSMAAISIVNARLANDLASKNDALQRARTESADRGRELNSLYELERDAVRAPTFDSALAAVLERMAATVSAEVVEIAIPTAIGGCVLHRMVSWDHFETIPLATRGLHASVFESEKTSDLCTVAPNQLRRLCTESELPWPPKSGLCVPLLRDEELIGSLGLYWRSEGPAALTDDRVRFVELAGQQIGHVLGHRLEQSEAERQDRLAAIGGALAGVVHDLKAPMTVASGYVQLLKTEEDILEKSRLADGVLEQLRRMNDMAREVLGFARGDVQILPRKTQVGDWCRELDTALQAVFAGTGITLTLRCDERGVVRMDSLKLQRAIQNLARNSREAFLEQQQADRTQQPWFDLHVFAEGQQLVVVASDNGPGVPRAFEHRMFDAFATHGKRDGTGLGLAMVKQVAEAHSGWVHYHQTAGGGATFELRISRELRSASASLIDVNQAKELANAVTKAS